MEMACWNYADFLISQWRRIAFIVGVKEAQNKYHTYITALTPQITSKDNGLLRKAESQ
jgi:hypothetical protein